MEQLADGKYESGRGENGSDQRAKRACELALFNCTQAQSITDQPFVLLQLLRRFSTSATRCTVGCIELLLLLVPVIALDFLHFGLSKSFLSAISFHVTA
eukprot:4938662-Pleurochrysis_carterae.AAC.2